jgi:uncharacterized protein YdhG (YjbR/CyaY superfamily)
MTRSRYSNFNDVDEYLLALDENRRTSLISLREAIRSAAPYAHEVMRYNMPYYESNGMLCAFTAQSDHLSFYVNDGVLIDHSLNELPGISLGKGCIRFQNYNDIPEGLIEQLVTEALRANGVNKNEQF